ncbi:MAG: nucleoside phosphorylase [Oscillospiraceae bacterium]|nr:nucleoside phosphorylase [Oscillospiraceae bacterium]
MAITKHPYPILEHDDSLTAVLQPDHEKLSLKLPKKAVFAFLGDVIDQFAVSCGAKKVSEFISITKIYPIYVLEYKGEEICLCQAPVGAAAAAQLMDWLIGYGVRKIITAGSCGVMADIPEDTFLVPVKALRDEGTSYHYLPPERFIELNREVLASIERTLTRLGMPYTECVTWTTDGFFRETRDMVAYRMSEGCEVVEMECAALAACAEFRGVQFGQLLFTADSLANVEKYDERNWGQSSLEKAMGLCLEAARDLE